MSQARSHAFTDGSVPDAYERLLRPQLFEPWARELLDRAGPLSGFSVLDVASGPGTVARLAAAEVGEGGRVVASDISAAMLAIAARANGPGSAPIECLECSAEKLLLADASFQLVLCQNGLQFFPDRAAAAAEMHRVLEPGGVALLSTWAAERPLGLFGPIVETMRVCGLPEPYPRAFEEKSYTLAVGQLRELFLTAGFAEVQVETVELDCAWQSTDEALETVRATPFGPLVASLGAREQGRIRAQLLERLGQSSAGQLRVSTASNILRAVKG